MFSLKCYCKYNVIQLNFQTNIDFAPNMLRVEVKEEAEEKMSIIFFLS